MEPIFTCPVCKSEVSLVSRCWSESLEDWVCPKCWDKQFQNETPDQKVGGGYSIHDYLEDIEEEYFYK